MEYSNSECKSKLQIGRAPRLMTQNPPNNDGFMIILEISTKIIWRKTVTNVPRRLDVTLLCIIQITTVDCMHAIVGCRNQIQKVLNACIYRKTLWTKIHVLKIPVAMSHASITDPCMSTKFFVENSLRRKPKKWNRRGRRTFSSKIFRRKFTFGKIFFD